MAKKRSKPALPPAAEYPPGYGEVLTGISELLDRAATRPRRPSTPSSPLPTGRSADASSSSSNAAKSAPPTAKDSGNGWPTILPPDMAAASPSPTSP